MSTSPVRFRHRRAVANTVAALLGLALSLGSAPVSSVADSAGARQHQAEPHPLDTTLRMNQIQGTGTHNSHKPGPVPQGLPPSLATQLPYPLESFRQALDHRHPSFAVQVPGGTPTRCNPVNAPASCEASDIENPRHLKRNR